MAATPEPLQNMATTPKSLAIMDATQESSAVMASTPVFPAVINIAPKATKAVPRRSILVSSNGASGWHPSGLSTF